jgi:hypothetical protein
MRISRKPFAVHIMINQKQLENVNYCNDLGGMIKNYGKRTREINFRIAMAKAAFNRKKTFFARELDLNLKKKRVKCNI